jgi:hypothetical protein
MNEDTYPTPEHGWVCFHCGEHFPGNLGGQRSAQLHFGKSVHDEAKCQITARALRNMELQLRRYQEEDTDLHRKIASLKSDHATALQREEEKGYARGIKDYEKLRTAVLQEVMPRYCEIFEASGLGDSSASVAVNLIKEITK